MTLLLTNTASLIMKKYSNYILKFKEAMITFIHLSTSSAKMIFSFAFVLL